MTDSDDTKVKLVDGAVEWREVDGEIVALDVGAAEYIAVTGSGAALWANLAEGTTRGALVELLTEQYRVDEATATADVTTFLETLSARGLLAQT